jgi:lipopolysaccharide export system permease protein
MLLLDNSYTNQPNPLNFNLQAYKYIFVKTIGWFVLTLMTILFVISCFDVLELIRRTSTGVYVPTSLLVEMVILKWPQHISQLLPFIVFLSVTLCFLRLNQNNEIVALKSLGFSVWQMVKVNSLSALSVGIVFLAVVNPLGSAMKKRLSLIEENVFNNRSSQKLFIHNSGLWFREVIPDKVVRLMHAREFDFNKGQFKDVSFYEFDKKNSFLRRIDGQKVTLEGKNWAISQGVIYPKNQDEQKEDFITLETRLTLKKMENSQVEPSSLSFWELSTFSKLLETSGLSARAYNLCWHKHIADIGFMIALALLALNFSIKSTRHYNAVFLIFQSILISFAVYFMKDIFYALGMSGRIPIVLATWGIPLIIAMLSISLIIHTEEHV